MTYVTANKVPVPLPKAPERSLMILKAPIVAPPKAAAVGMMRLSSLYIDVSRWPLIVRPWSLSCFATSRGPEPDTSIHVLEKSAQADSTAECQVSVTKSDFSGGRMDVLYAVYRVAWMGSSNTCRTDRGGLM